MLLAAVTLVGCVSDGAPESETDAELGDSEAAITAVPQNATQAMNSPLDETAEHGTIPGSFQVNSKGGAAYAIPIEVPPGLGGVQPKLELTYDSHAGNGVAGVGFNLAGLSQITRCARTMAQDNARGTVKGDANDRYCLDGQRLIAIQGPDGGNGTQYRTEIESWSRITSIGDCNAGACQFEVVAKDGTKALFGADEFARAPIAGGRARTWGLSRVTSTNKNYMDVWYTLLDGELYPQGIEYTKWGNGQSTRLRSVYFDYENRPDVETGYVQGVGFRRTKRLRFISTYVKNEGMLEPVRTYELSYQLSAATQRSLLSQVDECDATGKCLPPTTFTWPAGGTEDFTPVYPPGGIYQDELMYDVGAYLYPGDFDGDGRADFIRQEHGDWDNEDSSTFTVYESDGTAFFHRKYPPTMQYSYQHDLRFDEGAYIVTGDFDGDGRSDFIRQPRWGGAGPFRVHYSRAPVSTGIFAAPADAAFELLQPPTDLQSAMPLEGALMIPGDYNGDGKTDFIRQERGPWDNDTANTFRVYFSTGVNGDFTMVQPAGDQYQYLLQGDRTILTPGDFNGDGMTDFLRQSRPDASAGLGAGTTDDGAFYVYFSRGDGTFDIVYPQGAEYQTELRYAPGAQLFPGDFNGDGKADFVRQERGDWDNDSSNTIKVYLSRGDGSFDVRYQNIPEIQALLREERAFLYPLDFNGDGRMDLLSQEHGAWGADQVDTAHLYLSVGDGYFRVKYLSGYGYDELLRFDPGCFIQPADVDGDGNDDFLRQEHGYWDDNNVSTFAVYFSNSGKGADVLKGIGNGYGGSTTIDYAPLTDPSVHAIDPAASFAQATSMPMRSPLYVVRKVVERDRNPSPTTDAFEHTYFYKDGRIDQKGRGFLGFAAMVDTDVGTGSVTTTRYHHQFPLTGSAMDREVVYKDDTPQPSDNPTVNTSYTYQTSSELPGVQQVRVTAEEVYHKEGAQSYSTRTEYQYSAYGNVGLVRHKGLLGYDGDDYDTCTTFHNDPVLWRLGFPTNITDDRSCTLESNGDCNCGPTDGPDFLAGEHRDYYTEDGRMNLGGSWRWNSTNQAWEASFWAYDTLGRVYHRSNVAHVHEWIAYDPTDDAFVSSVGTCGDGSPQCLGRWFVYDPRFGEPVVEKDENGVVKTRVLDGLGRVRRATATAPNGAVVDVTRLVDGADVEGPYRETQRRTGWEDSAAWTSQREYLDGFGRAVRRVATEANAPSAKKARVDLDYHPKSGLLAAESRPYFDPASPSSPKVSTTKTYDSQGRLTATTDPAGMTTTIAYAVQTDEPACPGCVARITVTAPGGKLWTRHLDAAGRTVKQKDPDQRVTSFTYDRHGRKTSATDAKGTAQIVYDSLDRVIWTQSPDRGLLKSIYDSKGLLVETEDNRDQIVQYQYDGFARLTQKTVLDGSIPTPGSAGEVRERVVYEYDQASHQLGLGRLTTASVYPKLLTQPSSRYKFEYTADGQPASVTGYIEGYDYKLVSTFDPLGRARTVMHHDGSVVTRTFDVLGNLTSAKLAAAATEGSPAATIGADFPEHGADGQARSIQFTNGVETTYSYQPSGRLDTLLTRHTSAPAGVKLLHHTYLWGADGQLSSIQDTRTTTTVTQAFTFTPSGELASVQRTTTPPAGGATSDPLLTYGYDAAGNLTSKEGVSQTYASAGHRLIAAGDATYAYDVVGNRTTKETATGVRYFTYGGENRLERVTAKSKDATGNLGPEQTLSLFTYTFTGERASKTDADGTKTLYFGPDAEVTLRPAGALPLVTRYVSGPGGHIAASTGVYKTLWQTQQGASTGLLEAPPPAPGSPRDLLAKATRRVAVWSQGPAAPWQTALALALLAALGMAAAGPARVRRALRATRSLHERWVARFDTRFVRAHRFQSFLVPVLLASVLAGCQPGGPRPGGDEDVGSAEQAALVGPAPGIPGLGSQFFHTNHRGSAAVITSATGAEVARVEYKPFGEIDSDRSTGEDSFRPKFTGKEWDKDAGLYYFEARHYDPTTGRFLTADSYLHGGPEHLTTSLDPYAYAANNPVMFNDPSGHNPLLLILGLAILGAYLGAAAANNSHLPWQWHADGRTFAGAAIGALAGALSGVLGVAAGGGVLFEAGALELSMGARVALGALSGAVFNAGTEGARFLSPASNNWGRFWASVGIGAVAGGLAIWAGPRLGASLATRWAGRESGGYRLVQNAQEELIGRLAPTLDKVAQLAINGLGSGVNFLISSLVYGSSGAGSNGQARSTATPNPSGSVDRSDRRGPFEMRPAAQAAERFGDALIRGNMGRRPLVQPIAPFMGHGVGAWMAASAH